MRIFPNLCLWADALCFLKLRNVISVVPLIPGMLSAFALLLLARRICACSYTREVAWSSRQSNGFGFMSYIIPIFISDPLSSFACCMIFSGLLRWRFCPNWSSVLLTMQYNSVTCWVRFCCQWKSRCQTLLWCQKSTKYGVPGWRISLVVLYADNLFTREAFSSQ
jgi:hypothetical protein